MKHIAYLFSLLLTLTGCLHDPQTDVEEAGKTYVSAQIELFTRATANAEASAVKVESLRLLAFNEDGMCIFNRYYDTFQRSADHSVVSLNAPLSLPRERDDMKYHFYVVLNEHGFCSNGLSDALAQLTEGRTCYPSFVNLLGTPLTYESASAEVTSDEPAFVMCAYRENVTIERGHTSAENPFVIALSTADNPTNRTMAMITVNNIESDALSQLSNTARVFVLSAELINIPNSYLWDQVDNKAGSASGSLHFTLKEPGSDQCLARTWDGTISCQYDGALEQVNRLDKRYYRTTKNTKTGWNFADQGLQYDKNTEELDCRKDCLTKLKTDLNTAFASGEDVTEGIVTLSEMDGQTLVVSETPWTVNIGKSWYVPEKVVTDANDSPIAIRLRLAVATPDLSVSLTTWSEWEQLVGSITKTSDYSFGYNDTKVSSIAESDKAVKAAFNENKHYCWSTDPDMVDKPRESGKGYYYFIDNFKQLKQGTIHHLFQTGDNYVTTGWKGITTTEKVKEYIIPINNKNVGGDYSVRRNVHYQVSLTVTDDTYNALNSLAAGGASRPYVRGSVSVKPLKPVEP